MHTNKVGYENIGYKFLHALQQPLSATLMALRRRGWHPGQYGPDDMVDVVAPFLLEYSYSYAEYVAETALPFEPDGSGILIVLVAMFIGQGRLVSDLALVPWPNFIEGVFIQSIHIGYRGHPSRSSCITYGCAYVSLSRGM